VGSVLLDNDLMAGVSLHARAGGGGSAGSVVGSVQ
jgi:hypothetical protein